MTTLSAAHHQWATRPDDECYYSLGSLHDAAVGYKDRAKRTDGVPTEKLRVANVGGDVKLIGQKHEIDLTNWSFGQLSTLAEAPASYLQRLPADLAVANINHGLQRSAQHTNRDNRMLFDIRTPSEKADKGMVTLRALTSERYTRIWNADITRRLVDLESEGTWRPAPAAFDGKRGLYLSDRDMFAFLVDNDRRIFEKGPGGGLSKGFFVRNSEVGATSFSVTTFFYNYICGNHYVWGASGVREIKIKHVGKADSIAFEGLEAELVKYHDESVSDDELRVEKMRKYVIGKDLEEILDTVLGMRLPGLGKSVVSDAYKLAEQREDWYGAPNTMWGLAGGLTEIARDMPIASDRVGLEATTGKLMEIAF
jgi:hypothetical protein